MEDRGVSVKDTTLSEEDKYGAATRYVVPGRRAPGGPPMTRKAAEFVELKPIAKDDQPTTSHSPIDSLKSFGKEFRLASPRDRTDAHTSEALAVTTAADSGKLSYSKAASGSASAAVPTTPELLPTAVVPATAAQTMEAPKVAAHTVVETSVLPASDKPPVVVTKLNPNAKEFKFNVGAREFQPGLMDMGARPGPAMSSEFLYAPMLMHPQMVLPPYMQGGNAPMMFAPQG